MFEVLRDEESGISRGTDHKHPTAGSMVSVVSQGEGRPSCHWFTGTPDPCRSVFKPFIFTNNVKISPHIQSPHIPEDQDPAKVCEYGSFQKYEREWCYRYSEEWQQGLEM
ncbi:Secernin-1 [Portunus trituberculatus]|uniref:Secernin-1 n=1 Tax=Portunus trituberculatus TaxID=210409 RepID=A0A5B7EYI6_PORTR|nr:Secernin-1 [Portunus trituberculatus]